MRDFRSINSNFLHLDASLDSLLYAFKSHNLEIVLWIMDCGLALGDLAYRADHTAEKTENA
jgi:hypothetical protein